MDNNVKFSRSLMAILLLTAIGGANAQIQLGLLDDFEVDSSTCTTDGWMEGSQSPNPPTGTLSCGVFDTCCLANMSSGGFGPGSRQAVWNESQWAGDYLAAGVNNIQLVAANASATETLFLRVGLSNGTSCYVSTDAVELPPNNPGPSGLQFIDFVLHPSTMTSVSGNICQQPGADSLDTVLSNVIQVRLFSSASAQWAGDAIVSTLQLDSIQSKVDTDLDGVNDDIDNCVTVPNPAQRDTNGDGYGNVCDADLDNDCSINFTDLVVMKDVFFGNEPDADLNGDGIVNFADLNRLKAAFFGEPGPGQGSCGACQPPAALGTNTDFAGIPMFFRGGLFSDWGAVAGQNEFSDQTGGLYIARFEVLQGDFEWKIADNDWTVEYCSTTNLSLNTPVNAPLYGCVFPMNGTISIPSADCYEFQMQTDGNIPPNSVDVTVTPAN